MPFGKPYASEEILYREYLLQHFTPEQLDTAYYLSVQGVIEIYQVNSNGTETVLSTITKENYKNYLPHGFEPLRKDIETRFVFVELNPPAPDFSLTTNQAVYQGDPGQIIDAWVTIHNTGNVAESTDIGSNWQGEGNNWATTQFSYSKESIGAIPAKSSRTPVRIPITIPDSAQTIWFKANIDGNTPTSDNYQNNGIASALLTHLSYLAQKNGLLSFTASVLAENRSMVRVLKNIGFVHKSSSEGVIELEKLF
jgi:GNAT superfamily N-acetyltransferase